MLLVEYIYLLNIYLLAHAKATAPNAAAAHVKRAIRHTIHRIRNRDLNSHSIITIHSRVDFLFCYWFGARCWLPPWCYMPSKAIWTIFPPLHRWLVFVARILFHFSFVVYCQSANTTNPSQSAQLRWTSPVVSSQDENGKNQEDEISQQQPTVVHSRTLFWPPFGLAIFNVFSTQFLLCVYLFIFSLVLFLMYSFIFIS